MLKIRKVKQQSLVEYIAVFWIIASSGFFVLNYVYNIQCMSLLLLIACYFLYEKRSILKINGKKFLMLIGFIIADEIVTLVNYDYPINTSSLLILLIRLFALAVIMSNISISNFMEKYINIFVIISFVSLICFVLLQCSITNLPFVKNYQDGYYGSFYFRVNEYTKTIATRNSGPYGEPGIFSIYIVFALVFQLFSKSVNELTRGWNAIKVIVLAITLLTTLSATGLLCFLVIFITYAILNFKEVNILKNPIIFIIIIAMIAGLYYAEITYGILGEKILNQGGSYGVRMNDTFMGYEIARKHFVFGTGIINDYSLAWKGALLDNSRSNGLANFAASVGIPFLVYYLVQVFRLALEYVQKEIIPAIVFFIIILVVFNTQPVVFQTIGLSFLFMWKKIERGKYD